MPFGTHEHFSHAPTSSTLHSSLSLLYVLCLNIYHDASSCLLPVQLSQRGRIAQSPLSCSLIEDSLDPAPDLLGPCGSVSPSTSLNQSILARDVCNARIIARRVHNDAVETDPRRME